MTASPRLPSAYRLLCFAELDSTNDEAKGRAAAGEPHGLVVWAEAQSAGRGRRGRLFVSPPGNLYMSILLRPDRPAANASLLGFAAALAVGEAALPLLPPQASLAYKWPNDVLIDGRKTAGILLESQAASTGILDWLVVGIGVNLVSYPEAVESPATALAAAGARAVTAGEMLEAVAERFHLWYQRWYTEGFRPLRAAWLARAFGIGAEIRVRLQGSETRGRFAGLDEDGALLLEEGTGRRRIAAGDVFPAVG
jgi:BirA family transcriptional regulator, biotin operon repressor / biotin---[acetyl-CoA-carboxylase] ligase